MIYMYVQGVNAADTDCLFVKDRKKSALTVITGLVKPFNDMYVKGVVFFF